jgi:hypothetical protein
LHLVRASVRRFGQDTETVRALEIANDGVIHVDAREGVGTRHIDARDGYRIGRIADELTLLEVEVERAVGVCRRYHHAGGCPGFIDAAIYEAYRPIRGVRGRDDAVVIAFKV